MVIMSKYENRPSKIENLPLTAFVACLTSAGSAAIATVAVRGSQALELVGRIAGPLTTHHLPLTSQHRLVQLRGDIAEKVVVSIKRTHPVPWVELHCHGGHEVVRYLLELFQSCGAQVCPWQQFLKDALESPVQAKAAVALAHASTLRTAAILLDQYHGVFAAAVAKILEMLDQKDYELAQGQLRELVKYCGVGRHLTEPWRVVLGGAPNVGKSSLLNALAGYQRAVVAASPGTTRDLVTVRLAFDGWPVELIDTAGQRETLEMLEQQGIEMAREAYATADLCLWVLDASAPPIWPPVNFQNVQLVINKVDLQAVWDWRTTENAWAVSTVTGEGLDELSVALARRLVPEPPLPGSALPFTATLCEGIEEAGRLLLACEVEACRQLLIGLLA